jgi:hypothetical protein
MVLLLAACAPNDPERPEPLSVATDALPSPPSPPSEPLGTSGPQWQWTVLARVSDLYPASAISDWDGDGRGDLLLEDGTISAVPTADVTADDLHLGAPEHTPDWYVWWFAADLDGDGRSELLTFESLGTLLEVSVYGPTGADPPLWTGRFADYWDGQTTDHGVVPDVTGDGVDDLELNTGYADSDLDAQMRFLVEDDGEWSLVEASRTVGPYANVMGLPDLDGDGVRDLAIINGGADIVAGGSWPPPGDRVIASLSGDADWFDDPWFESTKAWGGDFDGDGVTDVAIEHNYPGELFVIPGPIRSGHIPDLAVARYTGDILLVRDIDGDGIEDVVSYDGAGGHLTLAMGPIGPDQRLATLPVDDGLQQPIWVDDQTGDGVPELSFVYTAARGRPDAGLVVYSFEPIAR